jgi:ATP-dependent Clp protease protease subunit
MNIVTCPIKTICVGRCSSAASVILASGAKNQRFAFKNSRIMIHGIQCSYPILGDDVKNSKLYLDSLEAYNDIVINILSENTGKSFEQVKKDCSEDVWMTPEQAKEYGIIDKIL